MQPSLKPVPDDQTSASPRRFSWRRFGAAVSVINNLMLIGVIVLGIMLWEAFVNNTDTMRQQAGLIESTQRGLEMLRHTVGSKADEDMIFLKIMILKPEIDPELARTIAKSVYDNCLAFKRDPDFILAIIEVESNFDPDAKSSAGALGLMQIMPHWKEQLNIVGDLTDPEVSIRHGMQIFAFYDQMYRDTATALTAYNRGPSAVDWDLIRNQDHTRNGYADKTIAVYERLKQLSASGL